MHGKEIPRALGSPQRAWFRGNYYALGAKPFLIRRRVVLAGRNGRSNLVLPGPGRAIEPRWRRLQLPDRVRGEFACSQVPSTPSPKSIRTLSRATRSDCRTWMPNGTSSTIVTFHTPWARIHSASSLPFAHATRSTTGRSRCRSRSRANVQLESLGVVVREASVASCPGMLPGMRVRPESQCGSVPGMRNGKSPTAWPEPQCASLPPVSHRIVRLRGYQTGTWVRQGYRIDTWVLPRTAHRRV